MLGPEISLYIEVGWGFFSGKAWECRDGSGSFVPMELSSSRIYEVNKGEAEDDVIFS